MSAALAASSSCPGLVQCLPWLGALKAFNNPEKSDTTPQTPVPWSHLNIPTQAPFPSPRGPPAQQCCQLRSARHAAPHRLVRRHQPTLHSC
ncbi:hypothetical protein P154DRAFT_516833 [Amniculicola lignicola CBS 123094]|uniref:Uncharacterized protein n=1 Tax=Amniculicola lignicola CBS 123094 TaxID=1392246 RepID=A0A6A5X5F8_9PLEO|nr:hypothetical protein P154DRAFT_516833 [Amniculicola lignicola CBS 123094]